MYALKVELRDAEKKKRELIKKGLYNRNYLPKRVGNYLYLPLNKFIEGAEEIELDKVEKKISLKDKYGISSFDIVGDTVIIFIPDKYLDRKKEIAEDILKLHRNIKRIYRRVGKKEGEFRITPLELIYGESGETIHKENGFIFKLDPTKVFFSPRQQNERLNVANEFKNKKGIATVFFAGIGPFVVYLSKLCNFDKIIAIEKNPEACKYMKENIKLNKCKNVEVYCGDVRDYCNKIEKADLLLMPLPKGSMLFLDCAKQALKKNGVMLIYVASKENELDEKIKIIEEHGFKVIKKRRELQIGPREYRFVLYAKKVI